MLRSLAWWHTLSLRLARDPGTDVQGPVSDMRRPGPAARLTAAYLSPGSWSLSAVSVELLTAILRV